MGHPRHWSLGVKLALIGTPFLLLALLMIAVTLWVSWQLEGGAAAVNEAGRMRMQAYRLSLSIGTSDQKALPGPAARNSSAASSCCATAIPSVRCSCRGTMPCGRTSRWSSATGRSSARGGFPRSPIRWTRCAPMSPAFAAHIDALVAAIETHMSRWTALLHLLQVAMMTLAVIGTAVLLYTGYLFVLEPVGQLKEATERIQRGDFGARVERITSDEFGTLAKGFNGMAEHLQSMYRNLEGKVAEKTSELQEKRERLEALYDVTTLVAKATTLDELAAGFARHVGAGRARGRRCAALVRRVQPALPAARVRGTARRDDRRRAVRQGRRLLLRLADRSRRACASSRSRRCSPRGMHHCSDAGFETVVSIPDPPARAPDGRGRSLLPSSVQRCRRRSGRCWRH